MRLKARRWTFPVWLWSHHCLIRFRNGGVVGHAKGRGCWSQVCLKDLLIKYNCNSFADIWKPWKLFSHVYHIISYLWVADAVLFMEKVSGSARWKKVIMKYCVLQWWTTDPTWWGDRWLDVSVILSNNPTVRANAPHGRRSVVTQVCKYAAPSWARTVMLDDVIQRLLECLSWKSLKISAFVLELWVENSFAASGRAVTVAVRKYQIRYLLVYVFLACTRLSMLHRYP